MSVIDPDNWVVTTFRILKEYVEAEFDSDIYDIVFAFPSASDLGQAMPLDKTLIHFEMDAPLNPLLGIGRNVVSSVLDTAAKTIIEYEGLIHHLNFDVGIWASARSGGVTARMEAYQILNNLFAGSVAFFNLQPFGIEIQSFNGGTFIKDEINDVEIFRMIDMTLMLTVYSRQAYPISYYLDSIDDFVQEPELTTADGNLIPS